MRTTRGRHRRGTPGLTWCGQVPAVAAALARPEVARRGLFERLLATARHGRPATGLARPALAGHPVPDAALA